MPAFHCSVDNYPSPGAIIDAADPEAAKLDYRQRHSVPPSVAVAVVPVDQLPDSGGSFRKLPEPKEPQS